MLAGRLTIMGTIYVFFTVKNLSSGSAIEQVNVLTPSTVFSLPTTYLQISHAPCFSTYRMKKKDFSRLTASYRRDRFSAH